MSELRKIHSITNRILDAEKNAYAELFNSCDELYETLISFSRIDFLDKKNTENFHLASGEAIGLSWAALCIKDLMRTKRFLDGVYEATLNKIKTHAGKPILILYTGTGPFATLVLPLTARFSSEQIKFSLLEVHDASFDCLQNLIKTLQLEKYIHRLEKADATKWKIPEGENVNIFICETMQQGLKKEPQVAICKNIVPQLSNETIMIPAQITLRAALINPEKRIQEKFELDSERNSIHELGTIFTLNKESILNSDLFSETIVDVSQEVASNYSELSILTEILIYNQEKLLLDESPLTLPLKLTTLNQVTRIGFQYQISESRGIRFSF